MGRKHRKWDELDLSEKLGYYWVGLFALLCIATAVAIFIPIAEEWVEEAEYSLSEEGQAEAAAYEDDDDDYDYDDEEDYEDEDDEDYEDESEYSEEDSDESED